jgi:nucleoside-diphosphate-sugar epimerase
MRVFVTGATGFIGNAVVRELLAAGHEVTGLVRLQKARALDGLGARAVVGNMKDPESYRDAAAECDAMIHAAAEYSAEGILADRSALDTLLDAARQGDDDAGERQVIFTSGIWVLGDTGGPVYEDAPTDHPAALVAWRITHEQLVLDAATDRLATAVLRPGMVYGGSGSLVARYFATAEQQGAAQYVGDGQNHVPFIHVADLARFYRALVEHRGRGIFHAVDGECPRLEEVARAAGEAAGKGGAIRSLPLAEARQKVGPMADCLVLDWRPQRGTFLQEAGRAYREWKASQG